MVRASQETIREANEEQEMQSHVRSRGHRHVVSSKVSALSMFKVFSVYLFSRLFPTSISLYLLTFPRFWITGKTRQAWLDEGTNLSERPLLEPLEVMAYGFKTSIHAELIILVFRSSFKCPVPSCSNKTPVTKADLEVDRRTLRVLKARQK